MLQYIFKRILYFIPTFFLVSLIIFFLSKAAGEVLKCELDPAGIDIEQCMQEAHIKGYDLPIFYFTFTTAAHPDTLYRIFREERRNALNQLIGQYGNWPKINNYYNQVQEFDRQLAEISLEKNSKGISKTNKSVRQLFIKYQDPVINSHLTKITATVNTDSLLYPLQSQALALKNAYETLKKEARPNQLLIPNINWYGANNQYHFWITNFLIGNFGISHRDSKPVIDKIKAYLPWTLYINIPAIIIAYLLAIPLGVYSAIHRDSKFDKTVSGILLLFYSLPVFWIGTLLVNFFTTPEYGMKFFPSILSDDELNWENIKRLFLPIFCITYGALAFMTRQMRSSMLETLQKDFIRTAKAKGLSEKVVIWKHAFRNSLFPLITIFGSVLPAAFAGGVVVEYIFNVPGMGTLLLSSIQATDWPVVYSILMIAAILTMLGLLIADIMYVFADPRVRLDKK